MGHWDIDIKSFCNVLVLQEIIIIISETENGSINLQRRTAERTFRLSSKLRNKDIFLQLILFILCFLDAILVSENSDSKSIYSTEDFLQVDLWKFSNSELCFEE